MTTPIARVSVYPTPDANSREYFFAKLRAIHAVFGMGCPYTSDERKVATVLVLDRCDAGYAYRGQDGIAQRAGISRRSAQRALASLIARTDGPLVVHATAQGARTSSGGRATNHYWIELRTVLASEPDESEVVRQYGAEGAGDLCVKTDEVVRQDDEVVRPNAGGLCVTVAQDRSIDRRKFDRRIGSEERSPASRSDAAHSPAPIARPLHPTERQMRAHCRDADETTPEQHRQVAEAYAVEYGRARGTPPILGPAEAKAINRLLRRCGGDVERAAEAVRGAYADEWTAQRVSILDIARDPAKFMGRRSGRPSNKAAPRQPGHAGGWTASDATVNA